MSLNQRMEKRKFGTFTEWSITSAVQSNGIKKFACKWIELEKIILSEATQTQKDTHGMYSLISSY